MFGISLGPRSVPAHAFLVHADDGELCLDWKRSRVEPDAGDVLDEFAGLATEEETGPAVVRFVQRFGPLSLCREHGRGWMREPPGACTSLRPEPISLWLKHARAVASVLQVKAALDEGREPDPHGVEADLSDRPERMRSPYPGLRIEIERIRGGSGGRSDRARAFHNEVDEWEREWEQQSEDFERRMKKANEQISEVRGFLREVEPSSSSAGWKRAWIQNQVNRGLFDFSPNLSLELDSSTTRFYATLSDSTSLLSRVYFELAMSVSGTTGVAFCTACAQPYAPKRRPKKGQDNFCPDCRMARVPAKLGMRRSRSQA